MDTFNELDPPARLLLGPGPSPVHPRVTRALAAPALGHLDPALLQMLEESRQLLRRVFRTANPRTLAVSGTGMAGMEAVLGSLVEPGERLLVRRADQISGAHGVAIHRRIVEGRQSRFRSYLFRQHAAQRLKQRHRFRLEPPDAGENGLLGFGHGEHGEFLDLSYTLF